MKSKIGKPRRLVVLGFAGTILLGTVLLALPVSSAGGTGMPLIDSYFTATSAVCVTGLSCVDVGKELSVFGQIVLAALIQIGGLSITSIGVMAILGARGKLRMGKQLVFREALNLSSGKELANVIRTVFYMTVIIELAGAVLSYPVFVHEFGAEKAAGISAFHSIASFNNAGFDLMGNYKSLMDYRGNSWLYFVTEVLIILGGLGFFVIKELLSGKKVRHWSLHTKVVLVTTVALLAGGAVLLKLADHQQLSWGDAFFHSVSARTAGFAGVDIGSLTMAANMVLMVLMFIGASPGSTGGGIKTTTFFVLLKKMSSVTFHKHCGAFKRTIPDNTVAKAVLICNMGAFVILVTTFCICLLEPKFSFLEILFEIVSAFSTTGLSMGVTPQLCDASKILIGIVMFIGRLGPLTMATVWFSREVPAAAYSQEDITIG